MEYRARMERAMLDAIGAAEIAASEYADLFGRHHPILETYRADDAELLLVTSGTIAGTARAVIDLRRDAGEKIGLAKIRLFRPFPFAAVRRTLGGAKKLAVIDRNISFGHGGIMASEIRSALCNQPAAPVVFSYIAGLGGRDVTPEVLDDVVENTRTSDRPEDDTLWVGLKD
jgi:pyruvate ferredoxin oxidoreductase alpha subunit